MAHDTLNLRVEIFNRSREKTFQLSGRPLLRRERRSLVLDGVFEQFDSNAALGHVFLHQESLQCRSTMKGRQFETFIGRSLGNGFLSSKTDWLSIRLEVYP
jgi:hypothetical protein